MTLIGFHCSHEQIAPAQLLRDVQAAERAGFGAAMCSDHIAPWSTRQGESGHSWSWLGAALATTRLRFGLVVAPGQRYHPVEVAHALATLGSMFPGRIWAALGSGENLNEHVTGDPWPAKEVRQRRLRECVDVIRRLHAGDEVSHEGLVRVDRAQLWTLPEALPPLIAPAVSVATAADGAEWADGLATINQPHDHLRKMVEAFRSNGGTASLVLQVHLSWAPSEDEAIAIAMDQWHTNVHSPPLCWDLDTPAAFEEISTDVSEDDVRAAVRVSSDIEQHVEWIREYTELGFDEIYLHHVGQDQGPFIKRFGAELLPRFASTSTATSGGRP